MADEFNEYGGRAERPFAVAVERRRPGSSPTFYEEAAAKVSEENHGTFDEQPVLKDDNGDFYVDRGDGNYTYLKKNDDGSFTKTDEARYDDKGNPISVQKYDEKGEVFAGRTDYKYDEMNRLTGETEYLNGKKTNHTDYEYGGKNGQTRLKSSYVEFDDKGNEVHRKTYSEWDEKGQPTAWTETLPRKEGGTVTYDIGKVDGVPDRDKSITYRDKDNKVESIRIPKSWNEDGTTNAYVETDKDGKLKSSGIAVAGDKDEVLTIKTGTDGNKSWNIQGKNGEITSGTGLESLPDRFKTTEKQAEIQKLESIRGGAIAEHLTKAPLPQPGVKAEIPSEEIAAPPAVIPAKPGVVTPAAPPAVATPTKPANPAKLALENLERIKQQFGENLKKVADPARDFSREHTAALLGNGAGLNDGQKRAFQKHLLERGHYKGHENYNSLSDEEKKKVDAKVIDGQFGLETHAAARSLQRDTFKAQGELVAGLKALGALPGPTPQALNDGIWGAQSKAALDTAKVALDKAKVALASKTPP